MREPYGVTIDGVRYVPAREAVANLDDIRTAIEDVFWGEGYKTREERDQYELWVQVSDDGEGTPLAEFMDDLAAKITRDSRSQDSDEEKGRWTTGKLVTSRCVSSRGNGRG